MIDTFVVFGSVLSALQLSNGIVFNQRVNAQEGKIK
jgi:hypothetical protein